MGSLTDVCAVVVHHKNFPIVLETIRGIIFEGVDPAALVVVDNSEQPEVLQQLGAQVPRGVLVESVSNQGYAQAVNVGVNALRAQGRLAPFVLISTHETVVCDGALQKLRDELSARPATAVVGPTLVAGRSGRLWSEGGMLDGVLGLPSHSGSGRTATTTESRGVIERHWLDGAFCLYQSQILLAFPMREDFFMYIEELELHTRLRRAGFSIGCVTGAYVKQDTAGAPPYLLARNLQRFYLLHGSRLQQTLSVPWLIARGTLSRIGRRQPFVREWRRMMRGWIDELRGGRRG